MTSEIEGCELDVANGQLLGGYVTLGDGIKRAGAALTRVEGYGLLAEAVDERGG